MHAASTSQSNQSQVSRFLKKGNEAFLNTAGGATLWGIWVLEAELRKGGDDLVANERHQMLAAMLATVAGMFSTITYLKRQNMTQAEIDASWLQAFSFANLEIFGGAGSMLGVWTAFRVGIDVFFGVEASTPVFYLIDGMTIFSGLVCAHSFLLELKHRLRSEPNNIDSVSESNRLVYEHFSKKFSNMMLHCAGGWSATWGLMSVISAYFYFSGLELITGETLVGKAYVGGSLAWSGLNFMNATYQFLTKEEPQAVLTDAELGGQDGDQLMHSVTSSDFRYSSRTSSLFSTVSAWTASYSQSGERDNSLKQRLTEDAASQNDSFCVIS